MFERFRNCRFCMFKSDRNLKTRRKSRGVLTGVLQFLAIAIAILVLINMLLMLGDKQMIEIPTDSSLFGILEVLKLKQTGIKQFKRIRHSDTPPPDNREGVNKLIHFKVPSWQELHEQLTFVELGGRFKHPNATNKVTIIIPYRDRLVHLKLFLNHMHPFLMKQNLDYAIYVVEMEPEGVYRKTLIMNAGFREVTQLENTPCVFFHDIDMFPTNPDNLYFCDDNTVRHYAVKIQQYKYKLLYQSYIGGVIAFPTKLFRQVNGYSNLYCGWGGDDDDMYNRIKGAKLKVTRPDENIAVYDSWPHKKSQPQLINKGEFAAQTVSRMKKDGVSNVKDLYNVDVIEERSLFTWILIRTNQTNISNLYDKNNRPILKKMTGNMIGRSH